MREGEDANRTREAGHLDEIQGVVANTLKLFRQGASLLAKAFGVGFIDWLGLLRSILDVFWNLLDPMIRGVTLWSNNPHPGIQSLL